MKKVLTFLLLTLFFFNCNSTQYDQIRDRYNKDNIASNLRFYYNYYNRRILENKRVSGLLAYTYYLKLAKISQLDAYYQYRNRINIHEDFEKLSKNYKTKMKGVFAAPFITHPASGGHMSYDPTPPQDYLTCHVINLKKEDLQSVNIKVFIYDYKGNIVRTEIRKKVFKRTISQFDDAIVKQNFKTDKKLRKMFESQIGKIEFIVTEASFEKEIKPLSTLYKLN